MAQKVLYQTKNWWLFMVLGILVLLLGGYFLANPLATISTVALFTGIYFVVSGISGAITAIVDRKEISLWGLQLVIRIILTIAGIFMLTRPTFIIAYLWVFASIGFICEAVTLIVLAIGIKKANGGPAWVMTLILGILIGIAALMILSNPLTGLSFVAVFVAVGVICFGINLIIISVNVKPTK